MPVPGDQGYARLPGGAAHHLPGLGAQAPPPVLLPRQSVGGPVQHLYPQRCSRWSEGYGWGWITHPDSYPNVETQLRTHPVLNDHRAVE